MKNVLILFSYAKNKIRPNYEDTMVKIQDQAKGKYSVHRGAVKELEFGISNSELSVYDPLNKRELDSYDLVFFRLWQREHERATAAAIYLKSKGVEFFDSEPLNGPSLTKLTDLAKLATNNIPVPDTFFSSPKRTLEFIELKNFIAYPLIVKDVNGTRGNNNHLVNNKKEALQIVQSEPGINFMLQQYVPNDCDYRFVVADSHIALVIRRSRDVDATHLNNTSAGADGQLVDLDEFSPKIQSDVIRAAKLHNRQFCGVDVIIDKDSGNHYILEVNAAPDLVVGAAINEKIKALDVLIQQKLKEVDV